MQISELLGKTVAAIHVSRGEGNDRITFSTADGKRYVMFHSQDCCESVDIEDISGDLEDLIGAPILRAEEATSDERPMSMPPTEYRNESETWTFYKLATNKGSVDIRWYGSSNGYYSESVEFAEVAP